MFRNYVSMPALSLGIAAFAPDIAVGGETQNIDVPAQSLRAAIAELARETNWKVSAATDVVKGKRSTAVVGELAPSKALEKMLQGTGLSASKVGQSYVILEDVVSQNAQADEEFDLGTLVLTTARRTTENVQDVPGSVQVLTEDQLERANIGDFADAIEQLPNVNIATNSDPFRGIISIRGISSQNILSTAPTVGVFQNGVLQNSTGLRHNVNPTLIDLERVEVLFGPQGTAFGRGTIGGAINYVTAKPKFETEGSVRLSYNDIEEGTAEVVYNTPLSETLALRFVAYGAFSDGFVDAPFSADTSSLGTDNLGARVSLRFQPNDRLTIDASVQYDDADYDAPLFVFESSLEAGDPIVGNNAIPGGEVRRTNFFFEAAYETGIGLLTSTTGYLDSDLDSIEDFDFSPVDDSLIARDNIQDTFSQEIRLESRDFDLGGSLGTVSFNIGANYSQTDSRTVADFQVTNLVFMGFPLGPGTSNSIVVLDVENFGVFGDIRWKPIEALEISVGGRYSFDEVQVNSSSLTTGSAALLLPSETVVDSASFSDFTPNVSILYDWTDNFSTYATYSTGYKPGGFANGAVAGFIEFDEESAENFEIGFRANLFDGALAINASAFTLRYKDIQVPIPTALGGGIDNAARAQSDGIELSLLANPIPGLTISGGIAFTDARFTDFTDSLSGDLTDTRLPNAPRRTFNLTADYEFQNDFRGLTPFIRGEFSGTSGFTSTAGDTVEVGDYNLFNLRAGLRSERLDVSFFVENLFDETFAVESFSGTPTAPAPFAGDNLVVPGEPRTFGVIASVRF